MLELFRLRYAVAMASVIGCTAASAGADSMRGASQDAPERPYVGVSGAHAWANDKNDARDGIGLKLSIGRALSERWTAGLSADYLNFEAIAPGGIDSQRVAIGVEAMYAFNPSEWTPLLLVSGGAVWGNGAPDKRHNVDFTMNGGLGLLTPPLNDHGIRMRLEARYVYDGWEEHKRQVHAYLGVTLPLPRTRVLEVVREEMSEVMEGPGAHEKAPRDGGDDGVIGSLDDCLDTVRGAHDDPEGYTSQSHPVVLQDVHFDFDSAQLTGASLSILAKVAEALRERQTLMIEVAGHTDSVGSDAYNLNLSSRRAQSVVDFLVARGVERMRFVVVGYGESRPVANNSTAEGRASNRRVELRVLSSERRFDHSAGGAMFENERR